MISKGEEWYRESSSKDLAMDIGVNSVENNIYHVERKNSSDSSEHSNDNYREEQRSNGSESKKFACEICDATFTMIGNLNRHKKGHSNHRPYTCNFCLRGFLRRTSYNEHIRLHTGEKPYQCDICLQTFVRKKCHQMHIRKCKGSSPVMNQGKASYHSPDTLSRIDLHELQQRSGLSGGQPVKRWASAEDQPLDLSYKHPPTYDILREREAQQAKFSEFIKAGLQLYLPYNALQEPLNMTQMNAASSSPLSTNDSIHDYEHSSLITKPDKRKHSDCTTERDKNSRDIKFKTQQEENKTESVTLKEINDTGSRLWPCKYCKIYFSDHLLHMQHMRMHDEGNHMICTVCSKLCKDVDEFLIHH